jgi:hypothetical protein
MAHQRIRALSALVMLPVLILLAGCSGDGATRSPPAENAQTVTTAQGTAPSTAPKPDRLTGEKALGPADDVATEMRGFTSPTGNVGCYIDPSSVRCDIDERDWAPPPKPADCRLDYGQGIALHPGHGAEFICAGDTTIGGQQAQALAYGDSISAGSLVCESAEAGMTCRDNETGHGFSLSREAYRIF